MAISQGPAGGPPDRSAPIPATAVTALREGTSVDQVFLVVEKEKRVGQTGKAYGHILLRDRTGEVTARVWDRVDQLFPGFEAGQFVRVRAEVKSFNGRLQLNVGRIERVNDSTINMGDFLPHTRKDVAALERRLREIAEGVKNAPLKALLFDFLDDAAFMTLLRRAPAAKRNHHAWVGGLLEHVVSLAELAGRVASWYRFLDADLVVAGVFFHDLGKVRELAIDRMPEYTDEGKLVGHIAIGYQLVTERAGRIAGFPAPLLQALQHIILSHHGELAFGSPVIPQSPEAVAVAFLDNLDAKMSAFEAALADSQGTPGNWTAFSNMFGRALYRGPEPAPGAGQ